MSALEQRHVCYLKISYFYDIFYVLDREPRCGITLRIYDQVPHAISL